MSLSGGYGSEDSVKTGETFTLNGRSYRLVVAPTGHKVLPRSLPFRER